MRGTAGRPAAALVLALGALCAGSVSGQVPQHPEAPPVPLAPQSPLLLDLARKGVEEALARLDASAADAARRLSATGISGEEARKVLRDLCAGEPSAVDCSTVTRAGKMLAVEPPAFRRYEGSNISAQEQVRRLFETGRPVLSAVFRAVEGFDAADLEHPVPGPDGKLLGSVSVLFRPEALLGRVLFPVVGGTPFDLWAMEPSGRVLWDPDPEEVGRRLLDEQPYSSRTPFASIVKAIAAAPGGTVRYTPPSGGFGAARETELWWLTVDRGGAAWRIVFSRDAADPSRGARRTLESVGLQSWPASLRSLAARPDLASAMAADDLSKVLPAFDAFLEANPGLYAVQWVGDDGIGRGGSPVSASLPGYDFRASAATKGSPFVVALAAGKETVVDQPLLEGGTGRFFLVPVALAGRALGMVYAIRILPAGVAGGS